MKDLCLKKLNYVTSVNGKTGDVTIEPGEGTVEEAPKDGNQYARKDGKWVEIEGNYAEGDGIDIENNTISVEKSILDDINDLVEATFPYSLTKTAGNQGSYETGRSITGSATFSVTRKGQAVSGMSLSATSGNISGYSWGESNITSNKTITVSLVGKNKSVNLNYYFYYYRYKGSTSTAITTTVAAENYIKNTLYKTDGYRDLSNDIVLDKTPLAKNNYYVFCVPQTDPDKYIEWTVNHAETGGKIGYQVSGSVSLTQRYDTTKSLNYEYVVVPASNMDWNFKITGVLKNKS